VLIVVVETYSDVYQRRLNRVVQLMIT